MEPQHDNQTQPIPGCIFVTIDERNRVVRAQIHTEPQADFQKFIQENYNVHRLKPEIPSHWMSCYHVPDLRQVPKLNLTDNTGFLKELMPLEDQLGIVKDKPVNLIDASFCIENKVPLLSPQADRVELHKLPKYRDFCLINQTMLRRN